MKRLISLLYIIFASITSFAGVTDVTYFPASPKPSITEALQGVKSYSFDCISNGQRLGKEIDFIDAFFIRQMKRYMEMICPEALFGIHFGYPSCSHVEVTAQYNHNVYVAWNGCWTCSANNIKVTFRFGLGSDYIYSFNLPNFKQREGDFDGSHVYLDLYSEMEPSFPYRFDESKVLKLHSYKTAWREASLMNYYSTTADEIEGVYESTVSSKDNRENKYKLGLKKMQDGNYALIYLGGANKFNDWNEGEIKAFLTPTSSSDVYKAKWLMLGKDISDDYYITLNSNSMAVRSNDSNEIYLKLYPTAEMIAESRVSSGTGFFINTNGYIITNYHCVENAKTISISGVNGDNEKRYKAEVEVADKQNDLTILKIVDPSFTPLANLPYSFKFTTSNVGEDCFVLGYPLISTMGKDIKVTNGIISSKSGYDGNIAQYQISAAVQPGNSGGPVFDKNGNIIGIVQAKHSQAENAGYAIKSSYIRSLVEFLPSTINLPTRNLLAGKTLSQQVRLVSKGVCIVIVNDD